MEKNKKNIVINLVILFLGIILGIVISKFLIFNNKNSSEKVISKTNDQELVDDEGNGVPIENEGIDGENQNESNKQDNIDSQSNPYLSVESIHHRDVDIINKIIENFERPMSLGDESMNFVVKELYGKDKVKVTDIDKKILKEYAFKTYLSSDISRLFYMNYVEREEWKLVYNAEELNKEVLNKYKYLFQSDIGYDSISGCPEFEYNSKDKKYYSRTSCGNVLFPANNYKYEFNENEYVAYRHVTYDKLNIDNNYKLTFRFGENDKGEKVCLPSPYCFDLYSIEKID